MSAAYDDSEEQLYSGSEDEGDHMQQDWDGEDSGDDSLEEELEALRQIQQEEGGEGFDSMGFEGPPRILNVDGIQTKLDEIALPADWHWIETMEVVPSTPLVIEDINQDLAREVKFYELGLLGVKEALVKLKSLGIPYVRPGDYYADMVKPPNQMDRIKDSILGSQRRKEAVEERKRRREQMKYAKQLKAHQVKVKSQQKLEAAIAAKEMAKKGGLNNEMKVPRLNAPSGPEGASGAPRAPQPNRKRKAKDLAYGYGGKKKFSRSNDKSSASDFSGFNIHKNNSRGFGSAASASRRKPSHKAGGKPSNKAGGQQRPGKARRASMRQ